MKRACSATIATAAAVALAAGTTGPASAEARAKRAGVGAGVGAAADSTVDSAVGSAVDSGVGSALDSGVESAVHSAADPAVPTTPKHRVTLITGDRVVVDAKGRVVGLERAKGRERIPVQVRTVDGHTLVVPADAARLIATGTLDQRLFDVTELSESANRRAQKQGLKLIVGYRGAASAAKADVRDAGDTLVRRALKSLNADAVLTPKADAPDLWSALTDSRGGTARTASGIAHVWLDGVRQASLDRSVKQIGADKAWAAGYDGKGVRIAVLDSGVDTTHPDLKDQVVAAKNFSTAPDATDKNGHGTHVASIAAGTGAKSGGKYKGVAPGAKLLSAKVLDDDGVGDDSGIIAGMDWAAEQGADIINLSLGGGDTPEVDPVEAQVNKLSTEKGILFAIAAGNSGEDGEQSVGSPASAAAALAVGVVDDSDRLAPFSSTGPGLDGAVKPDVTAPGVDTTAASAKGSLIAEAVGEKPAGYVTLSGTSMATPHVAGAAALLKQQHPDWTYTELKAALTGSAKGGKYTAFQQGAGRIQVDRAIKQTVLADPSSVSFGIQQWPHTDDTPVTKKITYKNLGTADVTLSLSATATDPKGRAAPAGFFTLGARTLTVPAGGGTASVDLTVNTKLGGTLDGGYSAYVTASGGGQSVRTAAGVQREVESYDVTLRFIDRDGNPAKQYSANLGGVSGLATDKWFAPFDESGTVKVRAPRGGYLLDSAFFVDPLDFTKGADWVARPKLSITKDTTITVDARTAKPVDIAVPDPAVTPEFASPEYVVDVGETSYGFGWWLDSYANFRTAHAGPEITDGSLYQQWGSHWAKDGEEYSTTAGARVKKVATGYTKHYKASELATLKVGLGASTSGKKGAVNTIGWLPGSSSAASSVGVPQTLPGTRKVHVSTAGGVKWELDFEQHGGTDADGFPITEAYYTLGNAQTFKAGKTYEKTFNTAVFGPRLGSGFGIQRDGNEIYGYVPLFADGKTHAGSSLFSSVTTTLYRNGSKVGSNSDPLFGEGVFKVPAGDASYKLTTSVKRSVRVAAASTRIDASWTFRSKKVTSAALPASSVRFDAAVGLDSRAPAGRKVSVPVTVQGSAAGKNLKSLSVYVSYDYGKTWKKLTVKNGRIGVTNPAKGKGISFHAKITDRKNNKSTISIYNAYYGK
ncbi:S8 family serine peptidase [Streptomyces sp. NBC_00878]|uniref:S8 family peptidase n=1 Tax=Streptomyces sp. NBC_00878 TaxID=2975854 RepID=UPI002253EBDA|nr:S8 family serine peptidase [Streptomyces sp. NBC_00878]MCX4905864.1 S8 family serine peptidase [Streptomyces sp. NBC_00878]